MYTTMETEPITLPHLHNTKAVDIVLSLDHDDLNQTSSLITKQKLKNEVDSNAELLFICRGERKSSRESRKEDKGNIPSIIIDFNQGSINIFVASNREKRNEEELKVLAREIADLVAQRDKINANLQSMMSKLNDCNMDLEYLNINMKLKEKNYEPGMYLTPTNKPQQLGQGQQQQHQKMGQVQQGQGQGLAPSIQQVQQGVGILGVQPLSQKKFRFDTFLKMTFYAKEIIEKADKKNKILQLKDGINYNYKLERKKDLRLKDKIALKKKRLNIVKQELADYYHQTLYAGIDYRQEGFGWIIKAIWNLDKKVEIAFFPPFLDGKSIDYLFRIAHKNIKISKYKDIIETEKMRFFRESMFKMRKLELKDNNNDFFSTSLRERTLKKKKQSYLHAQSQIQERYHTEANTIVNGKGSGKGNEANCSSVEVNLKSLGRFFEEKKRNCIDYHKSPVFLRLDALNKKKNELEAELSVMRREEMKRLAKEFLFNDYQKKYNVSIEIVIGALVGE